MEEQHTEQPERVGEPAADELPPELVEAIQENPEEVAALFQRLGMVNDLLDAMAVASAGLDDEMVMRLTETGTNLGAAADGMATPEVANLGESVGDNADELAEGVETIAALQRDGTLDQLAQLGDIVALASAAMDDEMVMTLAGTGSRLGEVVDEAADEDTVRGMTAVLSALGDASDPDDPPEPVGAFGMVRAMRDPEVKAGMGFMIALARALGGQMGGNQR